MTSEIRQPVIESESHGEMPPSGLQEATVGDIGEFNELVRGWNLDFRQLDRGLVSASVAQRAGSSTNITRVYFDRAIAQAGGPPPGMRTFGVRLDTSPAMEWCGQEVQPESLLCFHPTEEFQCLSPPGFAVYSLSVRESQLAAIAVRLGHPGLFDVMRCELAIDTSATAGLADLRRLLSRLLVPRDEGAGRATQEEIHSLESQITEEVVMLVAEAHGDARTIPLSDRAEAVRTAVSYIQDHDREAVTVSEICEATGVSWRTLDRAFKEKIGASPKRCVSGLRLRGARRELLEADPEAQIADIANQWGYWHMGDFAMNYRREFGELPSTTLAKERGGHEISVASAFPR
jgi:AraC family ethanolamine operon transcriptional activator